MKKFYKNKNHSKKAFALSQIFLLVISVVAFGYAIGSSVGEVRGIAQDGAAYWDIRNLNGNDVYYYHVKQSGGWYSGIADGYGIVPDSNRLASGDKYAETIYNNLINNNEQNIFSLSTGGNVNGFYINGVQFTVNGDQIKKVISPPKSGNPQPPPNTLEPAQAAAAGSLISKNNLADCAKGNQWCQVTDSNGKDLGEGYVVANNGPDGKPNGAYSLHKGKDGTVSSELVPGAETIAATATATPAFNGALFTDNLWKNFVYTGVVYGAIQLMGNMIGVDKNLNQVISNSATLGFLVGSTLNSAAQSATKESTLKLLGKEGYFGASYGTWIGIATAVVIFASQYRDEKTKTVQFSCIPWQPPRGGNNCDLCNNQKNGLPCSEYQCRSLGQACQLVNKGTITEKCVWQNRNDVNPPVVSPSASALLSADYSYVPDNAVLPPDRGVQIKYAKSPDGCIPAFTPLRFGITTIDSSNSQNSEPAKCKIDSLRKDSFDNMSMFMDNGLIEYNHTFSLSLPSPNSTGIQIQNGGQFSLYVRCEDANGNANIGNFVFNYCVDKGADTTPPLIIATSVPDKMPFAFNQTELPIEVYANEPAECKWSHNNRDYETMDGTMDCSAAASVANANAQGLYTCKTTLTGLKDRVDNLFYFKCKDQPGAAENSRNTNKEPFTLTLRGTEPLAITSASPDGETIKDATDLVKVTLSATTSAGQSKGQATCYYSATGNNNDYVAFLNTNSYQHSQDLYLTQGTYLYYIRCTDLGGNFDSKNISFNVESDHQSPIVARAYHEDTYMKIVTNEPAQCVYDVVDCNYQFADGIKMTDVNDVNHFTKWDPNSNLYIKCQDKYGNQPAPNQCSIIVNAFNV